MILVFYSYDSNSKGSLSPNNEVYILHTGMLEPPTLQGKIPTSLLPSTKNVA